MGKNKELQYARREARDIARRAMSTYEERLLSRLAVFDSVLKPRPRWMPRAVWQWCASRFVDIEALQSVVSFPQERIDSNTAQV